ncbi:hypothetical protein AB0K89_02415 [Streptomyces cinnamoneus]|uniref:hypothetical protein n=1 Tax=Streptomyces cinnamoneus TaxID=53446 RepID=UPI00343AB070
MKRTTLRALAAYALVSAALAAAVPAAAATGGSHAPDKAAAHTAKAAAKAPSVAIDKILIGQGTIPSVLVSFNYACTAATEHLDVTLTSFPSIPAPATYLKATKAKRELRCDGAQHAAFVEWTDQTIDRGTPARAVLSLYDKAGELQVPTVEKTMKPGTGTPPIGIG